uniref:Uncharacterized protein n=1 Tax=Molossus molossus TaxID=27622 RepID=A0A7J8C959_MOLMO|nr:hypothetical protein HJG59_009978 [Molossus molossus]
MHSEKTRCLGGASSVAPSLTPPSAFEGSDLWPESAQVAFLCSGLRRSSSCSPPSGTPGLWEWCLGRALVLWTRWFYVHGNSCLSGSPGATVVGVCNVPPSAWEGSSQLLPFCFYSSKYARRDP